MSSTTVAQHTTQPLNFGPEWLRALSTPDATTTTPVSSSGASSSGNVFKFSSTKYRYSKEQILALRTNVSERLAEDVRNEILENLKDVDSVFRQHIIEPLTLTAPTSEEASRFSSLSSYISGRTPGGAGRGGHSSQQSQQQPSHDQRLNRGGSSMSNGRGGSRGRGGREHSFGLNRGNTNPDEHGETGGGADDSSGPSSASNWSRGAGFHSRGGSSGGGPLGSRVRSYDDRDQPPSFRRGGGNGRQTSETWRRSRGDDDENNEQNEEPGPNSKAPSSWTTRGGQSRRGGSNVGSGGTSTDHRTKTNDNKWSHSDERSGQSNSHDSSHVRSSESGGWRTNSTSDRDLNSRRPLPKREKMPEWMNDNNEGDVQLTGATFEQCGTFVSGSSTKPSSSSNSEIKKIRTQSSSEEVQSQSTNSIPPKAQEEVKVDRSTPPRTDNAIVNVPSVAETLASKPTSTKQQTFSSWDDEFEPGVVATTVVEATLAEDHDYSPPVSAHPTPHPIAMDSKQPAAPIIPQPQRKQAQTVLMQPSMPVVVPAPVNVQQPIAPIIDDKQWFYRDPQNTVQGPFSSADMERWFTAGYFNVLLPVKRFGETQFTTIQQLTKEMGRLPFRSDGSSHPASTATNTIPSSVVNENINFDSLTYSGTSVGNSSSLEELIMQTQQRPNIQHGSLFSRQTSMPAAGSERRVGSASMISPQMQSFFAAHQQQASPALFAQNIVKDSTAYQSASAQLQRSISVNNQQISTGLYDDVQSSFRPIPTSSATSGFFSGALPISQSQPQQQAQPPEDIMTRLAQAMQSHGQQQQEKADEQRRLEQQRRESEIERLKMVQKMEQLLPQREEEERRRLEQQKQQQMKIDAENLRQHEANFKKQMLLSQMKEMTKTIDQKKSQQQTSAHNQIRTEIDPMQAFQKSLQFQKEQQAKIEAQKEENIRRYQQQLREAATQNNQSAHIQQNFKLPEAASWARHSSQSNETTTQPLNFAEIQKQEQEQERRAREAILAAQQHAKNEASAISGSSSNSKPNSWAQALFAGSVQNTSASQSTLTHSSSNDHENQETHLPESPITSYNQQATNAVLSLLNIHPKSRSTTHQQAAPWSSAAKTTPSTSLYDIQLQQQQQLQSEAKQQQQQQQQAHSSNQSHGSSSTAVWGGVFPQSNPTPQGPSPLWRENQNRSPPSNKPANNSGNKSSNLWSDVKAAANSSSSTKSNQSGHVEVSKSEREAKHLFNIARTQGALTKWTETQFKDNSQAIDVPTLVQLLEDIESAEEIVEYVQPYIGSVAKSREFANDFIVKRKQLAKAEPSLDNERLNALAMAPTSSSGNSNNAADEGFQVASSNGQKKKAKKMKGQKIDVKQLGFMVNNRPEQRDGIDRVQM